MDREANHDLGRTRFASHRWRISIIPSGAERALIVVEKPKLKFLLAGRPIQVDVRREYRKGRIYAIALPDRRSSVCRAMILDALETDLGIWRVTIRHAAEDRPRLLAARLGGPQGDYTDRLDRAAYGEPEPLSASDLDRYGSTSRWRDDLIRRGRAEESQKRPSRRYAFPPSLPCAAARVP